LGVTDEQIDELLRDPAFPWSRVLGMGDERAVRVEELIAFARSRGLPTTELERRVDSYVRTIGGRREHVLDPWSAIPNFVRRLAGGLPRRSLDLWVMPIRSDQR
jgi:hypothetical protein